MQSRVSMLPGMSATIRVSMIVMAIAVMLAQSPRPTLAARPPDTVEINKCCRIGEMLTEDRRCLAGSSENWWPVIFQQRQNKFFAPRGEAPRFMKARENSIPNCEQLELVMGANKMAVFTNGSLLFSERGQFFDAANYCVDQDTALVCMPRAQRNDADALVAPIALTKVKKCCPGSNLVYNNSEAKCVTLNQGHALFAKPIIANTTAIDLIFGFPSCNETEYTIAGLFDDDHLDTVKGSLSIGSGQRLQSGEYCLEHTTDSVEANSNTVSVFTCAQHIKEPKITQASAPATVSLLFMFYEQWKYSTLGRKTIYSLLLRGNPR